MAARIDHGGVQVLTRSGLDWTPKYPATAVALAKLKVTSAYFDGELCSVRPDGATSFAVMQQASDHGGAGLVHFVCDLPSQSFLVRAVARFPVASQPERKT